MKDGSALMVNGVSFTTRFNGTIQDVDNAVTFTVLIMMQRIPIRGCWMVIPSWLLNSYTVPSPVEGNDVFSVSVTAEKKNGCYGCSNNKPV